MILKKVDIKEFKKVIFPEYKKLFPPLERKPYYEIKRTYKMGITEIFEIIENDKFIGFITTNSIENNPAIQLEYLGILPKYQDKGYGTEALKSLINFYKNKFDFLFVEIEQLGYGSNNKENEIRKRRSKFYKNIGFIDTEINVDLYNVMYGIYIVQYNKKTYNKEEIKDYINNIYITCFENRKCKKYCKFI